MTDETFEDYGNAYIAAMKSAIDRINLNDVFHVADCIAYTQFKEGRLFILGIGGSAGNASHAVNDFRKICGIEAYAPTDNVSELTARINDDTTKGWDLFFVNWLKTSNLNNNDTVMILSVGGGSTGKSRVSRNLANAVEYAKNIGAGVVGIVGKSTGYTYLHADACVLVPEVDPRLTTPITEAMQSVVLHLIATEPGLARED